INKLRQLALVADTQPLCHLTLALLTETDNPKRFTSAKSVLDGQYKLGIVDPSIDGLGEASWNVLNKMTNGLIRTEPPANLYQFARQYELLEALEDGEIDAALVWDVTSVTEFLLAKYADEFNERFAPLLREAQRSKNRDKVRSALKSIYGVLMDEKKFGTSVSLENNPVERYAVAVPMIVMTTSDTIGYSQRLTGYLISNEGKAVMKKYGFTR
ncbi:MAG: substrate-binding domain-containing protein, partial [Planctomycetaceae bacterium]|nr:substrate-binding domain-containing protein [Planctomycetaceae bacterium]